MLNTFKYKQLELARVKLGLSRREILLRLYDVGIEVSEDTVANWENGQTSPDAKVLGKLAQIYHLELDTLYET